MRKSVTAAGLLSAAFLFVGCQNGQDEMTEAPETANGQTGPADESQLEDENEANDDDTSSDEETDDDVSSGDDSTDEENGENSNAYSGTQVQSSYLIDTHLVEADMGDTIEFLTAFSFTRDADQQQSHEENIEMSLVDGDPSEQNILDSYADISLEWPELHIYFNEDGNELSLTSAQMMMFYDSLFGISDLYGIGEISFFNPNGEIDINVGERSVNEPFDVGEERGLSRGYYTLYDEELEQTLFLSGGDLEEPVTNESEEPFSFEETVETMKTVEQEDAFYSSAMVEGIEVLGASIQNGIASVQYTMDEEIVTEEDQIVFENAIQLAALDFHAWEVKLQNDTTQEVVTYHLVGQ